MGSLSSMTSRLSSAMSPVASAANSLGRIVNATAPARAAAQSYALAQQQAEQIKAAQQAYQLNEQQRQNDYAIQKAQLHLTAQKNEQDRRNALKRAVAKQQSAFGAQGLSSAEGSGEAVLLGLFEESNADRLYRDRLNTLKNRALDQDNADIARRNLLNLQQKRADNAVRLLTTIDDTGTLLSRQSSLSQN